MYLTVSNGGHHETLKRGPRESDSSYDSVHTDILCEPRSAAVYHTDSQIQYFKGGCGQEV